MSQFWETALLHWDHLAAVCAVNDDVPFPMLKRLNHNNAPRVQAYEWRVVNEPDHIRSAVNPKLSVLLPPGQGREISFRLIRFVRRLWMRHVHFESARMPSQRG
jgi:hypothetical protein